VALVLIGVVAGPGYWAFARLYGGTEVGRVRLQADGAGGLSSPAFRLVGDMAPVALVLAAHGDFLPVTDPYDAPRERYRVRLYRQGVEVQAADFELAAPSAAVSEPVFRERVLLVGRLESGDFHAVISPRGDPRMTLGQATLEIRRDQRPADGRVVLAGLGLAAIGLLGLLLAP
jgi:hypothetical protein